MTAGKFRSIAIALTLITVITSAAENCYRIGTNLQPGDRVPIFINVFKQSRVFGSPGLSPLPDYAVCDTNGYPTEVPFVSKKDGSQITSVHKWITTRDGPMLPDSVYVCRWDGTGEITIGSWGSHDDPVWIDSIQNDKRLEFKLPVGATYALRIKSSKKGDHVRNIRIYLKSQEKMYEEEGKIFNPHVIEILKPFYMFRFMGAFSTNNSPYRQWDDRTRTSYYHWKGHANCGLAYEYAVRICNETKSHMYFCVPHAADAYSIRKMAELVRDQLDPDLDIYLEYSNETWNVSRPYREQHDYVKEFGKSLRPDLTDLGANVYGHAVKSKFVYDVWREVFGSDSLRVRRTYVPWDVGGWATTAIDHLGVENFDVLSSAFYWTPTGEEYSAEWNSNTTVQEMIDAAKHNLSQGRFYEGQKRKVEFAKLYGKELFHKEGGFGRDPIMAGLQDPVEWLDTLRALQTHPAMLELQQILIDTLTSLGIEGGCELTLTGGWCHDPPGVCTWGCSQWGAACENLITASQHPHLWPKLQGYYDNMKDCDSPLQGVDSIGSGQAIRLDGDNDYVDFPTAYKPNDNTDNYTVECWVRPEGSNVDQCIMSLGKASSPGYNKLIYTSSQRFRWEIRNNAGTEVVTIETPVMPGLKYYHLALRKSAAQYTVYVNGIERGAKQGNTSGDCTRSKLAFGADITGSSPSRFFKGRIDEIRLWAASINQLVTIRDWMCRKLDSTHPDFASLRQYYRFDAADLSGVVKDDIGTSHGQLQNVTFSKYSSYVHSGAPIGDFSHQVYPADWNNVSLTHNYSTGDWVSVSGMGGGGPNGVHLYLVNQKPNDTDLPSSAYYKMGGYFFGVFMAGGTNPTYKVVYNYSGNANAGPETDHRLLKRDNNSDIGNWRNSGAALDVNANILSTRPSWEMNRGEYIFAKRQTVVTNASGPGMALKFDTTGETYAKVVPFFRPDDDYTVSCWVKTDIRTDGGWLFTFTRNVQPPIPDWAKSTRVGVRGGSVRIRVDDISVSPDSDIGIINANAGWNHVAMVKSKSRVTIYMNGLPVPGLVDVNIGYTSEGIPRDIGMQRLYLGYDFKGTIDDFQVWNAALSQQTIREWMCRKLNPGHPYEQKNCIAHFNFDEGSGRLIENRRGPGDMEIFGEVQWVVSGAPLGDTSRYVYGNGSGFDKLSIGHGDGDSISVEMSKEQNHDRYHGYHLYRTDASPDNTVFPPLVQVKSVDTSRYWGVFMIHKTQIGYPHQVDYKLRYHYRKNKNVIEQENIRLLDRKDNSGGWHLFDTAPDTAAGLIMLSCSTKVECNERRCAAGRELLLGGLTETAIMVDAAPPSQPLAIVGDTDLCAGQTNKLYHIEAIPDADYYIWELPEGLNGFSQKDSIFIAADASAGGTGVIRVKAGNRYGESQWRTLDVTIRETPALSAEIIGPSEICANQIDITYAIPQVSPAPERYVWQSSGDAQISGSGTSAKVSFGTDNIILTVYGEYSGCGNVVLSSKPVAVMKTPRNDLPVTGGTLCKGIQDEALVTISGSELGVQYRAYKNNGTAPVGSSVYGNGDVVRIFIGANELLAGDNILTIKAKVGDCAEVDLLQRATVRLDVAPDPNTEVVAERTVLCPDDSVFLTIRNTQPGVTYYPVVWRELTIDNPHIFEKEPYPIGNGEDIHYVIPPSKGHSHFAGNGVNIGRNKIWFKANIGGCPTVFLKDTIDILVQDEPRILNDKFLSMTGNKALYNDTVGLTVTSHPEIRDHHGGPSRSLISMCTTDEVKLTILRAEMGATYTAYRLSDSGRVQLSDPVKCTVDFGNVDLTIPPFQLDEGIDQKIGILSQNDICSAILANTVIANVYAVPDKTLRTSGQTVCPGENGKVSVFESQEGISYRARVVHNSYTTSSQMGNGDQLIFNIPSAQMRSGVNNVVLEALSDYCSTEILSDTAVINNTGINPGTGVKGIHSTICSGNSAIIVVQSPQEGVLYSAQYGNTVLSDSAVVGEGDSVNVNIPAYNLVPYVGRTIDVSVKARTQGGSCSEILTKKVSMNIRSLEDAPGYPIISAEDSKTRVVMNPWISRICYELGDTVDLQYEQRGAFNGLKFQGSVNGAPVGVPTNAIDSQYFFVGYPRNALPKGETVQIGIMALSGDCPPEPVTMLKWGHSPKMHQEVEVPHDYNLDIQIGNDSVCSGEIAALTLIEPPVGKGFEYRIYDPAAQKPLGLPEGDGSWKFRGDNRNLELPIFDIADLKAYANEFEIQVRSSDNCQWIPLNNRGIIYVNKPPRRDLVVEGSSVCDGDGTLIVKSTEGDTVIYTPYMASLPVALPQPGNGGDLEFTIKKEYLVSGSNEVIVRAQNAGCGWVTLEQSAVIQRISVPPEKPSAVTGPAEVCANQTGVLYSVTNDQNALFYTWTLPDGAATNSKSNSAVIDFGNEGGTIQVTAHNACGESVPSSPVTVSVKASAESGTVSGPDSANCGDNISLSLTGHTATVMKWQWSEDEEIWNDIFVRTATIEHALGNRDVTFRAVVQSGECGQLSSMQHTVHVTPCAGSALLPPVPVPPAGSYASQTLTVKFEASAQDTLRDIYYVVCSDLTTCSMAGAQLYNAADGIVLDIAEGPKGIKFQARPKAHFQNEYFNSSAGEALYIHSSHQLGVPVPNPGAGTYKDSNLQIKFEKTDQSQYRQIFYAVCNDTAGCQLTASNRQLYNDSLGIRLDMSGGQKAIMYQAVPLDQYANSYQESVVGKALYLYRPGILVRHAAYVDVNSDGFIDGARLVFEKEPPELPYSIKLHAPYNMNEVVTVKPKDISGSTLILDLGDNHFTNLITGFEKGSYGRVEDSEGIFNTDPFDIADSVAPVILSARYTMAEKEVGGKYYDTLTVIFSEPVYQSGSNPFLYIGSISSISLTRIEVNGATFRAVVPVSASDKTNTLQPGDSIAIRTDLPSSTVADLKGNVQKVSANRRAAVALFMPNSFTMDYGPTLFNPSSTEFRIELRPNERITKIDPGSKADITLLDGTGNVILRESFSKQTALLEFIWNGRNQGTRLVGQGTYLGIIKVKMNGMHGERKVKVGVKR